MARRFRYEDEEDELDLFDSLEEIEGEMFGDDSAPFYEDPDDLAKIIEEELGTPARRRKRPQRT